MAIAKMLMHVCEKMDNAIFGIHGNAEFGCNKGSGKIVIFPLIFSLIFFIFYLRTNMTSINRCDAVWGYTYLVLIVNELLFIKRVFYISGLFKKFLYPFFVGGVTVLTFSFIVINEGLSTLIYIIWGFSLLVELIFYIVKRQFFQKYE